MPNRRSPTTDAQQPKYMPTRSVQETSKIETLLYSLAPSSSAPEREIEVMHAERV